MLGDAMTERARKLCHAAEVSWSKFSSCSDMFLCKLRSVISAANSAFVALLTTASASNHDSHLPQRERAG